MPTATNPAPTCSVIELDVSTETPASWLSGSFCLRLELASDGEIVAAWSLDSATGHLDAIPVSLACRIVGCTEPGSAFSSVSVRHALLDLAEAQAAE